MNEDNDRQNRRKTMALLLAGCAVPLVFVSVFLGVCFGIARGFELCLFTVVMAMGLIAFAVWVLMRCGDAPSSDSDESE